MMHMNAFIARLAALSTDAHPRVRTVVCQAITTISSTHVAVLEPYFTEICQFMLVALQDTEECVAIESCEFWAVMLETADTKRAIMSYLHTLVEHLIKRLYLTPEQMEQERVDEEEENSGEKELNLRPMHHRASHGSGGGNGSASNNDAEDKENAELSAKWTLRKQAALLLDTVALSFPPEQVLQAALPRIQECFQHGNVLVKECGMLALGALSTGACRDCVCIDCC
jgi:transportin-1